MKWNNMSLKLSKNKLIQSRHISSNNYNPTKTFRFTKVRFVTNVDCLQLLVFDISVWYVPTMTYVNIVRLAVVSIKRGTDTLKRSILKTELETSKNAEKTEN